MVSKNTEADKIVYTIKEVQEVLGLGKNNVYKLLKLPTFPVIKIGKRYLIPKKELEEWVSKSVRKELLQ